MPCPPTAFSISIHSCIPLHAGRLLLRAGVSKLVFLFGRMPNEVSRGRYLAVSKVPLRERSVFGSPELRFNWCLAFSHPLPTSTYTQRLRTTSQSLASQKRCVRNPYTRCRKGSFETARGKTTAWTKTGRSSANPWRGRRQRALAPSILTCTTCTLEKSKLHDLVYSIFEQF